MQQKIEVSFSQITQKVINSSYSGISQEICYKQTHYQLM